MKNRFRNRLKDRTLMFGDVRRMPSSPAAQDVGILGVHIEYNYKDDPKALALRLGELYQDISVFDGEARSYTTQANAERMKATEMEDVLRQIEADPSRESLVVKNPVTGLPRRMNPYKEYSIDALIEAQLKHTSRATEFDETAAQKRRDVAEAREEINDVQAALERLKD